MGLKQLPNGKYQVSIFIDGKRTRPTFDRKSDAEKFERDAKLARTKKAVLDPLMQSVAPTTTKAALRDEIREYYSTVSAKKSPETHKGEKRYFSELYEFLTTPELLDPDEQKRKIEFVGEITVGDLEKLQTYLLKTKELSGSTVNRYFNTFRDFFNRLDRHGKISRNPAASHLLSDIAEQRQERKKWRDEDIKRVLGVLPPWAGDVAFVCAVLGARPCELKRLTWSDVDLIEKEITLSSLKGDGTLRKRILPIPESLEEFLVSHREKCRKEFRARQADLVFKSAEGLTLNTKALSRAVARATEQLGLEGFVLYGFRHTFITRLAQRGEATKNIGDLAGHTNLNTTSGYISKETSRLRDPITRLDEYRGIVRRSGA